MPLPFPGDEARRRGSQSSAAQSRPDVRALRRRCEQLLAGLPLPSPFDVVRFCDDVASRRGRPIFLHAARGLGRATGLWVVGPSCDVLVFDDATSPLHREHIILHELSHVILGHKPSATSDPELVRALFPHVSDDTVRLVLGRGGYSTYEEREAEVLASLILQQADRAGASSRLASQDRSTSDIGRLEAALRDGIDKGP